MIIKPNITKLFEDWGENYSFDICMRVLMESLAEDKEYDYIFFSGVSGDAFTQLYTGTSFVDSLSNDCFSEKIAERVFSAIGYNYTFVDESALKNNKQYWHNKVINSINNHKMVITQGFDDTDGFGLICGYENDDNSLYAYIRKEEGNKTYRSTKGLDDSKILLFIEEKTKTPDIKEIYRDIIRQIPMCFSKKQENGYYFGIQALEMWGNNLLNDSLFSSAADIWNLHGSPLTIESENNGCNHATGVAGELIKRAARILGRNNQLNQLSLLYDKIRIESESLFNEKMDHSLSLDKLRRDDIRKAINQKILKIAEYHKEIISINNF
ncbi:hypothetical protein LJB90_01895 [Eubacteriales bacterium OttesenSCG-928-G02]|nr:hypothetical protein [Eubacteriales bacterium OttesenSCG-928-G02]